MSDRVWSEKDLARRAGRRLAVLRHAEEVSGNVAATCRYYGISRNVFAPADSAFAQIDAATLNTLKTDDKLRTKILTDHVVPGQIAPHKIVGDRTTVRNGVVKITGTGNAL
ncbi:fasciclin domain-containing protein [Lentzea tibetensis]|uniref:fasciclin domain-containing protein n=1 Tax=Lentzea tibetensis TaxID=2591470 RepID=UPI001F3EFF9F|nr:fasciclin domain-containing protein [Lentzea tibetensis]